MTTLHLPKPLIKTVCCANKAFDSTHGPFIKGYLVNSNECLMKSNWWAEPGQEKKIHKVKRTFCRKSGGLIKLELFLRNTEL